MNHDAITANTEPETMPFSACLEKYSRSDPVMLSNRLGIPYDINRGVFFFSFLGRVYTASHPDLQIGCEDGKDIYALNRSDAFRHLFLRFLLYATVFPANGDFRSFGELPGGEALEAHFREACTAPLVRRYGMVQQVFEAIMENVSALRVYGADIAYELEFLDGLFIRFLFWRGGAGREPRAGILFSSNFPAAFSAQELPGVIRLCMEAFDAADPLLAAANPWH